MKYIFITENNGFGFKDNIANVITNTDVQISDEIYNNFFEMQSQGHQYKILNINGDTFEAIFEEVIPEIQTIPLGPSLDNRVSAIEEALLNMI